MGWSLVAKHPGLTLVPPHARKYAVTTVGSAIDAGAGDPCETLVGSRGGSAC